MDPIIGIDFGTSNSVVCEWQDGRARVVPNDVGEATTPSIVTLGDDGKLTFGRLAREQFQAGRSIRSIKRVLGTEATVTLGDQTMRAEVVAAALFRKLKEDAEARLHAPIVRAVVTVPANSKGLQRTATKVCAQLAGLQVLTLINEPTAAAMAYGVELSQEQHILVYDFGGGTFDVTILKVHHGLFEELASKGIRLLGGDDIDAALVAWVLERQPGIDAATLADPAQVYWAQRLAMACEEAKIALSDREQATLRIPGFLGKGNLEQTLTRQEFEALAEPFIARTAVPIDDALRSAGLLAKDIDRVLLVGGTSKIPRVRAFVAAHLDREIPPTPGVDPLTCVAEGAAIAAGIIQQAPDLATKDYVVRLEHSLCAAVMDLSSGQLFLDPIIARGSSIPMTATHRYYPVSDFTDAVRFEVYEGDEADELDHPDNAKLLSVDVPVEPARPSDDAPFDVRLTYGEDGILAVEVTDIYHDKVVTSEAITFAQAMLDEQQQAAEADHLDALFTGGGAAHHATPVEDRLLERARATLGKLDEADEGRPALQAALSRLAGELLIGADEAALRAAADAMREELASFAYLEG